MLLLQDSVRDMSASTVVRMLVQYDEQKTSRFSKAYNVQR